VDKAALTIGSPARSSLRAARLGLKVASSAVRRGCFRRLCSNNLKGGGELRYVLIRPGEDTGLTVILNRGADRAILTYPGLIPALRAEDIRISCGQGGHLHVASYFLQTALQPGCLAYFAEPTLLTNTSLDTIRSIQSVGRI